MKKIMAITISIAISGCATNVYNYSPKTTFISVPTVGEVATANIGERLLRQGQYEENEAICVNDSLMFGLSYKLAPGSFQKTGDKSKNEYFAANGSNKGSGQIVPIGLATDAKGIIYKPHKSELCVISDVSLVLCRKTEQVERCTTESLGLQNFEQTLIYSGRSGDIIKMSYREFSNNISRAPFTNAVEYDLSRSNEITYQGAKLEIVEADNNTITYRVISNFNPQN